MNNHLIKNNEEALNLILAGKSKITFENPETGNRFTYSIVTPRRDKNWRYVCLLTGPDNGSHYTYFGNIKLENGDFTYWYAKSAKIKKDCTGIKAFEFVMKKLREGTLDKINVYRDSNCCKCGKLLTTPESIESGYGPHCRFTLKNK